MALSRATFRHDTRSGESSWSCVVLKLWGTARQSVINFNLSVWTFIMTLDEMFHISNLRFNYKQITTASVAVTLLGLRDDQDRPPSRPIQFAINTRPLHIMISMNESMQWDSQKNRNNGTSAYYFA